MNYAIGGLVVAVGAILGSFLLEGAELSKLMSVTLGLWVFLGGAGFTLASYRPGQPREVVLGRLSRNFWIMGFLLGAAAFPNILIPMKDSIDAALLVRGLGYSLLAITYGGLAALVADAFNPPRQGAA